MAKDYFQDILPPNDGRRSVPISTPTKAVRSAAPMENLDPIHQEDLYEDDIADDVGLHLEPTPERSIRNISAPARRGRDDAYDGVRPSHVPPPSGKRGRRIWLWIISVVAIVVIASLLLVALRGTSVTVTPRSHMVVFDEAMRLTAFPAVSAASGTLAYTTQTIELEDSEPVQSNGTTHVETKASGNITITNDYSATPVKLIKNTRFESAGGLVFRIPADVSVPGKQGATPGQVTVTVVADQVGESYNVAPGHFTLPGLKNTPEFSKIYGDSATAFAGGFNGEKPGVSEGDLEGARATVRSRLEKKMRETIAALSTDAAVTFPELAQIRYVDLPITDEGNGAARIHILGTAIVPIMPAQQLAFAVARTVSAESDSSGIRIQGLKDYGALPTQASSTIGVDPLLFSLTGQAMLVWEVDPAALAQALAGRDQSAFQTIVTTFSGIQSATARIEPFWSNSFPSTAEGIRVKVTDPSAEATQ